MFVLEAEPGQVARVDSVQELREWLLGMGVDGRLKIKGLGRLLVLRNHDQFLPDWLCSFIPEGPLGKWGGRDTDLDEILAMARQMVAGLEVEQNPEPQAEVELDVDDSDTEVWRVVVAARGHRLWSKNGSRRMDRVRAGGLTYRAADFKPGTMLTIQTVVKIVQT